MGRRPGGLGLGCTIHCREWTTRGRFPRVVTVHGDDCANPEARNGYTGFA